MSASHELLMIFSGMYVYPCMLFDLDCEKHSQALVVAAAERKMLLFSITHVGYSISPNTPTRHAAPRCCAVATNLDLEVGRRRNLAIICTQTLARPR